MTTKDSLGDRMKGNYEDRYRISLTRRMPVIIRIDGKAFHTFTKGFCRPWDMAMMHSMQDTTKYLCENIMGCQLGYTQSDEISLLLIDYKKLTSQAWFDYNLQKICSVAASMATMAFNDAFRRRALEAENKEYYEEGYDSAYSRKVGLAMFDARAFNIPESEVCNYFIWRQQDATRNSIEMLGHHYFTPKELHKKNCDEIQEMLFQKHQINWGSLARVFKRGACVRKEEVAPGLVDKDGNKVRAKWVVDKCIPVFTQDREYVEKYLRIDEG